MATEATLEPVSQPAAEPGSQTRSGAAQMRLAANMLLDRDCIEIAQSLAKSSMEGHILSARFLYDLALKSDELGEIDGPRKFRSRALLFEEELASQTEPGEQN